jgi:hypothetical protein
MKSSSAGLHLLKGALAASLLMTVSLVSAASASATVLPTVSVALSPSSISVGGTLQSGAVDVVASATATKEGSVGLVLLKPGVSVAEFDAFLATGAAGKDPNTVSRYGSIVFDEEAPNGTSETQTVLAPGQYVAVNAEGEAASKWPHVAFTVTAAVSPASLPAAQATVRSIDFAFTGPSTLHDGELVRFENEGYVVHMDVAFPASSRANAKKLLKDFLAGREKSVEKLIAGEPARFAGPLSTGGLQQETIAAKPGWYVQVCFMDTQDGRPHTLLGMERIIKITK